MLTTVLETPEHAGRVRGVGNFIPPSLFFDLPKQRRDRITKEEFEKMSNHFEAQIAELKALIATGNQMSPIFSDKASCPDVTKQERGEEQEKKMKAKKEIAKELILDDDEDGELCVAIVQPPPPGKKVNPNSVI